MTQWRDVTETFSEEQRHYNNTYLEICEVHDETVEVSLFSSEDEPYEIYFSWGIFYGIVYADAEDAEEKRGEMKEELLREYQKDKEPTDQFISEFCKKHQVCMPNDILFNAEPLFEIFDMKF